MTAPGDVYIDQAQEGLVPGTRVAGGQTFHCPGVTGSLLALGLHTVAVSLALSNGSTVSDTAQWQIDPNREP